MERTIRFNGIEKVQSFAAALAEFPEPIEIVSGNGVIDAKSIMELFTLRLDRPQKLRIQANKRRCREICEAISSYIID